MNPTSRRDGGSAHLVLLQRIQRRLTALSTSLNRSRFGNASTSSFLENTSKLLQILAVVAGGLWALKDYNEFKRQNNKLTNEQLQLTNKTAELTQSSIDLSNQLSQMKLMHSTQGRLDITTDSSATLASKSGDGSDFLYRFETGLTVRNISDANITVPAMVVEVFAGAIPDEKIKGGKASLVNLPPSWLDDPVSGDIAWKRIAVYVQRQPEIDGGIEKVISSFPITAGGLTGEIDTNEAHDWYGDFVLRAQPTDIVASVITFWAKDERNAIRLFEYGRLELLSEARGALETRAEPPTPPTNVLNPVQHTEHSSPGVRPNKLTTSKHLEQ